MKLQIVYPEDGWILSTLAHYLIDNIDDAIGSVDIPDRTKRWDITYYMNYYLFRPTRINKMIPVVLPNRFSRVSGAWFTHKDRYRYESKAKMLDFCICPCSLSADHLRTFNTDTHVVYHGIDLEKFTPKIILGFIGRERADNRKGQDLFEVVRSLPFVELKTTGGTLSPDEIPAFYQTIDYVFIPAVTEGGPLCFQEGLASGKEIISTDVGMVHDFIGNEGIHIFDRGDPQSLITLLNELLNKKVRLQQLVESYSISYFVENHLRIFHDQLAKKS